MEVTITRRDYILGDNSRWSSHRVYVGDVEVDICNNSLLSFPHIKRALTTHNRVTVDVAVSPSKSVLRSSSLVTIYYGSTGTLETKRGLLSRQSARGFNLIKRQQCEALIEIYCHEVGHPLKFHDFKASFYITTRIRRKENVQS